MTEKRGVIRIERNGKGNEQRKETEMSAKPILWMVIPCYNEEQVLPLTAPMFLEKLNQLAGAGKISDKSRILFVNDGSTDGTWDLIRKLAASDGAAEKTEELICRLRRDYLVKERLSDREHCRKLYADLHSLRVRHPGWKMCVISSDPAFERSYGQRADKKRRLYNGRLECVFYIYH